MKALTVSDIMSLNPCGAYPESRVRELWGDRESLTLVEILQLDIPAEDRIWVLTRDGVCSRDVLVAWMNRVADRAVRSYCLECGIAAVEAWARGWLDGTDRTRGAAEAADVGHYATRAATRSAAFAARAAAFAARAAAYVARAVHAEYAAYYAAYAAYAACAAAEAAAESVRAAAGAACAAAGAACAAREAERRAQVDDLIRALNDEDEAAIADELKTHKDA